MNIQADGTMMGFINGDMVTFLRGPRAGQQALVLAQTAHKAVGDHRDQVVLTLRLPLNEGVAYAYSGDVELFDRDERIRVD